MTPMSEETQPGGLAALVLAMVRCRAAAAGGSRDYPRLSTSHLYRGLGFALGSAPGRVTDAVRAACATGQVAVSADGRWLVPTPALTPRTKDDLDDMCGLSDFLYSALRGARQALGVEDGVLAFKE